MLNKSIFTPLLVKYHVLTAGTRTRLSSRRACVEKFPELEYIKQAKFMRQNFTVIIIIKVSTFLWTDLSSEID